MPLWSLTQERIEKLRRQIGDIEMEVDKLIKLTKEDLWRIDLDAFIEQWRTEIDQEGKRKRRLQNMGRRASRKVTVGASGATTKKRKGLGDRDDDDDFEDRPKAKKPAASKAAAAPKVNRKEVYVPKNKQPLIDNMFTSGQGTMGKHPPRSHDGNSSEVEPMPDSAADAKAVGKKGKTSAKPKAIAVLDDTDEEVVTKPVARKARAAASKPISYGAGSDSDDSNGDDLLGDITNMVKGLPNGESKSSTDTKSLFATSLSMPNGNTSLKPQSTAAATRNYAEISDDDNTNFMGLVPQQSPRRSINVTKNAMLTDDDDEDEDEIRPLTTNKSRSQASKPSKSAQIVKSKPAVKPESEVEVEAIDIDDDDDDIVPTKTKARTTAAATSRATTARSKPSKGASSKPAAAAAAAKKDAALPKKKTTAAPSKKSQPQQLSPAAKAYAAKQAKNNNAKLKTKANNLLLDSDDEAEAIDAMADDLLDSPPPAPAPAAVAAGRKGKSVDVDMDMDSDLENMPPVVAGAKKQKAKAAPLAAKAVDDGTGALKGRPARRAATERKKPLYRFVDSDEEDDDGGFGGGDDDDGGDFDEDSE